MEDRETLRMGKYGESKTTRITMATVHHVTSSSGFRKFQADGFLLDSVYIQGGPRVYEYIQYIVYSIVYTIYCIHTFGPLCIL